MACEDQLTNTDLENAKLDNTTFGEVVLSKVGGVPGGAPILTATKRDGSITDTLEGRLAKLGPEVQNPIPDWTASTLITNQVLIYRYPPTTGELYLPKTAVPFTTDATFNPANWILYQSTPETDIVKTFSTSQLMSADSSFTTADIGKFVQFAEHTAGRGYEGGNTCEIIESGPAIDKAEYFSSAGTGVAFKGLFKNGAHPKQFGVACDGLTDDITQLNAFKDWTAQGETLELHGVDCYVSELWHIDKPLSISGSGATIRGGDAEGVIWYGYRTNAYFTEGKVDNIKVVGTDSSGSAFVSSKTINITYKNIDSTGSAGTGITHRAAVGSEAAPAAHRSSGVRSSHVRGSRPSTETLRSAPGRPRPG